VVHSLLRLTKTVLSVVALTGGMLAGTVLVTTSSASAHPILSPRASCPGGQLDHHDFFSGQISVFVHFSSASGGTNCAWAQKNVRRGTAEPLNAFIIRCATGNPANPCNGTAVDQDPGNWQFFSGPVQLTNTNNRCIVVGADYRGSTAQTAPHHCS
jgi:hypothetical protein